jgi:hypothetical protein
MTDNQYECALMLADVFKGFHHVDGEIKPMGSGLQVNLRKQWASTYDFDGLTRAVILAHDRMIRLEIAPSGPGMLKIILHKRHSREGEMHLRHPSMEEAIGTLRETYAVAHANLV